MKISEIDYFRLDMPLAVPYTIAYETVSHATNIILKLVTDKGLIGWGCAAPDPVVTGETPEDVIQSIEAVIRDYLKGQSPFRVARITHDLKQLIPQCFFRHCHGGHGPVRYHGPQGRAAPVSTAGRVPA